MRGEKNNYYFSHEYFIVPKRLIIYFWIFDDKDDGRKYFI